MKESNVDAAITALLVVALTGGCRQMGARTTGQSAAPVSPLLQPASPAMNQPAPARFKVLFETTEATSSWTLRPCARRSARVAFTTW